MAGSAMIYAKKSRCVFVFTINNKVHIIMKAENFAPLTATMKQTLSWIHSKRPKIYINTRLICSVKDLLKKTYQKRKIRRERRCGDKETQFLHDWLHGVDSTMCK